MQEVIQTYLETRDNIAALRQRQEILAAPAEPPLLEEVSALDELLARLDREQTRYERVQGVTRLLAQLETPPETAALLDLEHSLSALGQAAAEVSQQQAYLAALTGQLDRKKAEIHAYLKDAGLCPLCGSPLELEHFLESGHA